MNKDLFYQTGFYSLITLIIGFFLGSAYPMKKIEYVSVPVPKDTVYTDTVSKVSHLISIPAAPSTPNKDVVFAEIKRQGVKYPKIVLAQSLLETGHYTSDVCKKHNNLFGLMKGDKYHHFSHWKNSITYYKEHVQSRYNGGNYYEFLERIGYAEDKNYCNILKQIV